MPRDKNNVDLVIQYALLVAGQEDDYIDQQLGPIHLIKYVYLADLAHARRNNGDTFTGIDWRFYKFGPWAQQVNERIEPALAVIHADKKSFESQYEEREDWVRWNKHDDYLLQTLERKLPTYIVRDLRRDIHKYGKDTPSLLDYVYKTKPMLSAAPNEYLDFTLEISAPVKEEAKQQPLRMDGLSKNKQKKLKERMDGIRSKRQATGSRRSKLVTPPSPRYDDTYYQGIAWLDSQAGPELSEKRIVVEFSDDVWKSPTRKAKDVS